MELNQQPADGAPAPLHMINPGEYAGPTEEHHGTTPAATQIGVISAAPLQPPKRMRIKLRDIVKGDNPRKELDWNFIKTELAPSIKAQGLLQKPLLRAKGDKFEIVAGEQRIEACRIAFGEDGEVDVDVHESMSDEAARAAAGTENIVRRQMTPLDEAEAAARTLADCRGDRAEAARILGWEPSMLSKRLGLMNASEPVRQALRERKIQLGHAELLAALRKEAQDATLKLLLEQATMITVAALKQKLETAALVLDKAIFDTTACAGCQHNSSDQNVLFTETISGGKCTNKACFDGKTEAELEKRSQALKDEFQLVRIVRAGENFTVVPLVADGAKGVGEEQAKACRTCKDYGAVVSAVPDKLGQVYKGLCMNAVCHVKKVAEHHKPAEAPASAKVEGDKPAAQAASGAPSKAPSSAKPDNSLKGANPQAGGKANAEVTTRVKEYREKLWRKIYQVAVGKLDVPKNRAVLLALCVTRPSVIDHMTLKNVLSESGQARERTSTRSSDILKAILEMEQAELGKAIHQIAATVGNDLSIDDITGTLKVFGVKVADYWKIGKPFLELLTKNEIDAVCDEIGLQKAMGADYAKAQKGSKTEFIDAILAAKNFDFAGKIPKIMTY